MNVDHSGKIPNSGDNLLNIQSATANQINSVKSILHDGQQQVMKNQDGVENAVPFTGSAVAGMMPLISQS